MPLFIFPKTIVATENDEDLFHHLVNFINGAAGHSALTSMLAFLLLLIQAFMINYLVNEYRMMTRQNHLPAMAYLLITSLVPDWNYLSSPLISNTLIIWCFIKLFKLYNKANTKGDVFNIGLILGLSSYIYFPSAAFLICFLLGIMILKPFRLNEILLFLLGALTPYYFYGAYLFITGQFTVHNFVPNVSLGVPTVKSTIYLAISTFLLAIPFLVGGYYVQGHLHKMLIQVRKNWSIILLYLLLAFFVPFINTYMTFSNWILLAAPFATFHAAAYFYPNRNWFPMAMFLLTAGFVVYQQYFTNLWH
jgi:hypothetical protein